jgi:hypothetical protein
LTPPGILVSPTVLLEKFEHREGSILTLIAINIFYHSLRNGAFLRLLAGLPLEFRASIIRATSVQGTLERVSLPAEDVITMLSMSGSGKSQ